MIFLVIQVADQTAQRKSGVQQYLGCADPGHSLGLKWMYGKDQCDQAHYPDYSLSVRLFHQHFSNQPNHPDLRGRGAVIASIKRYVKLSPSMLYFFIVSFGRVGQEHLEKKGQ